MGKIHLYAEYSDGEMSECGRGFFADVSFEKGTSNINDVTCLQCKKLFKKREPKRIKDLNDYIAREVKKFKEANMTLNDNDRSVLRVMKG